MRSPTATGRSRSSVGVSLADNLPAAIPPSANVKPAVITTQRSIGVHQINTQITTVLLSLFRNMDKMDP